MRFPNGGRPTPARDAAVGPRIEQPARTLADQFNENDADLQLQGALASAVDAVRFDYLAEVLDDAATYAVSASAAARRGNHQLVKVRTAQAKLAVDAALEVEAELGSLDAAPA